MSVVDPKIKGSIIKAFHSQILAATGENVEQASILVEEKEMLLIITKDSKEYTTPITGSQKMIMKTMFISKLVSLIKKDNPDFKKTIYIILNFNFKDSLIEVLTKSSQKKSNQPLFYNLNM